MPRICTVGWSNASHDAEAVTEALSDIDPASCCFVLAFVPSRLNSKHVAKALQSALGGVPVFGCGSTGQISPRGYETDALVLVAFPRRYFRCASLLITALRPFRSTDIAAGVRQLSTGFRRTAGWNRLGLVLADGCSQQEDVLISTLAVNLRNLPIFGGSAGDGLSGDTTFVIHNGEAHGNAAVLVLIETALPFEGVTFDHFSPRDMPVVITEADPDGRQVYQINGSAAAAEYARLVGQPIDRLNQQVFAENPLLLLHNTQHCIRAVGGCAPDGSLKLLAGVEEGLVMTLGQGRDCLATLSDGLSRVSASGQPPDLILGFDCALRRAELEEKHLAEQASAILAEHRVIGFNPCGEQHVGLHINQSFVGVAFFDPTKSVQLS